jgi:GntR family transcriptional repressor for pyruvate dehydrogenase complex
VAEYLSDRLSKLLEEEIKAIPVGGNLPSERTLVARYGASRNIIREVLKGFAERGMIEIIPGKGARVVDFTKQKFTQNLEQIIEKNKTSIKDIVEVRESLEIQVFLKAMERATQEDYVVLGSLIDKMDGAKDNPELYNKYDIEFHLALADATKNKMYSFLIYNLYELTDKQLFLITQINPEMMESAQLEHKGILEAIMNHDAVRMFELAHVHFTDILSILSK